MKTASKTKAVEEGRETPRDDRFRGGERAAVRPVSFRGSRLCAIGSMFRVEGVFGGTAPAVPRSRRYGGAYGQVVPVEHWLNTTDTESMIGAAALPRSTKRKTGTVFALALVGSSR